MYAYFPSLLYIFSLVLPDKLYDGWGEGQADQDVDRTDDHVGRLL